ncbi:hypothetical protein CS022_03265 [Veronia nyctiphanis]|uniref:Uncharacterized protein n=1 Tax=Veronia nyctiphanis TaxID=1278244 RepID=A0A4Q0YZM2_9GAMM|nr:hypothetical protein [Veronia nyctiphanis]RXJ74601.1 hypothetical protein CS022_03265 [Veronia nyctiphanis]
MRPFSQTMLYSDCMTRYAAHSHGQTWVFGRAVVWFQPHDSPMIRPSSVGGNDHSSYHSGWFESGEICSQLNMIGEGSKAEALSFIGQFDGGFIKDPRLFQVAKEVEDSLSSNIRLAI